MGITGWPASAKALSGRPWLEKLAFGLIFTAVCLVHVSNIWRLDVYPFVDLPNHLAEAYLYKTISAQNAAWSEIYQLEVSLFKPAWLHTVFCALFTDVETGSRVYYTVYIVLLMTSVLGLVIMSRGTWWPALLSACFLYNFNTLWGYCGFTLGVALVMADVVLLIWYLNRPDGWRFLALTIVNLVLFYAHALVFLFVAPMVVAAMGIGQGLSISRRLIGLASLIPALVVFTVWVWSSAEFSAHGSTLEALWTYYRHEYWVTFHDRLTQFLFQTNDWLDLGSLVPLLFSLPILLTWIASLVGQSPWGKADTNARLVALIFTVMAGGCFFGLPAALPGQLMIYDRFLAFVYLGLIWTISFWIPKGRGLMPAILAVLLVAGHGGLWFAYFSDFKAQVTPFRALLHQPQVLGGRTLVPLVDYVDFRNLPAFRHLHNYHMVWNNGLTLSRIYEYRFGVVRPAPSKPDWPSYSDWDPTRTTCATYTSKYKDFEYLLVFGPNPWEEFRRCSEYELVGRAGLWGLFKNKLTNPVCP